MDWKKNLQTPRRDERLFKVGPYNMMLGDLVQLGFQPDQFQEVTDPWARKSHYNLKEIARSLVIKTLKAENKILETKE